MHTKFWMVNIYPCNSDFILEISFVQAAVSLAVVIPCLLELQDQHYGVNKGIPTLVMAAASFDNVFCISAFGVCLGIAFDSGQCSLQFELCLLIKLHVRCMTTADCRLPTNIIEFNSI